MFDYKQEIGLLHGSFISATHSNCGGLFDSEDVEAGVNIICKSVKDIIHYHLLDIKDENENIKMQLHMNEKLHAAVFFTVLRSYGIKSSEANNFYSSIAYSWPTMNLKSYLELNFRCDWSEYFIKCAVQLPLAVLCELLKLLLNISASSAIEYYIWHMILQTIILKLIEVHNSDDKEKYPFDFDFSIELIPTVKDETNEEISEKPDEVNENVSVDNKSDMTVFKEFYTNLCNCISIKIQEPNIQIIKMMLHAYKTLLKNLICEKQEDFQKLSLSVDLLKIVQLCRDCLTSDSNQEVLKAAFENCSYAVENHAYATKSWNISLNYLVLLIFHYDAEIHLRSSSLCKVIEKNELVYAETIQPTIRNILSNLKSKYFDSSLSEKVDMQTKMLLKIIQFHFEGQSYAADLILFKPTVAERNDVLMVLEKNSQVINFKDLYQQIIYCIHEAKSDESKLKLLKILYKLLRENTIQMYSAVLIFILSEYGSTEEFMLPDFEDRFSQFTRKTPTLKEADEILPELLVQNPVSVLKYLIDQALVQGSEGKHFIQLLQHFPLVCCYKENNDLPTLQAILNKYLEKEKLEAYESKNMVTLFKFFVEVQLEKDILHPVSFFGNCIVPKLVPDNDKIDLILECSYILMPTLYSSEAVKDQKSQVITSLVISLGKLVDHCIKTGNGNLKSLAIPVLKSLENFQLENNLVNDVGKLKCWTMLIDLNEMTYVYVKEFLPRNIEFSSKSFMWTFYCKNEDSSGFKEKVFAETLTYSALLNSLVTVLPHLTKEEWLYSFQLVKICCKDCTLRNEILCSFNKLFQFMNEAESSTYAVISCFVTALGFIISGINTDHSFIISCFSNGLMNFMEQEETVKTVFLIIIFLEICSLIRNISSDLKCTFTSVLLELKKRIINSCSVETPEKDCKSLISNAIACLPNSCEKGVLYQKLLNK